MTYQHTATDKFSATLPGRGQSTGPAPFLSARRAFALLTALLSRMGDRLVAATNAAGRVRLVEELHAKSDAELAALGIKRDEIVHHVYKDMFYA